eukprot:4006956-Lingulodinium_polyedra.AAC.1
MANWQKMPSSSAAPWAPVAKPKSSQCHERNWPTNPGPRPRNCPTKPVERAALSPATANGTPPPRT